MKIFTTHSPGETLKLGKELGKALPVNSIVCFFGELGAGKTTLIKGLASGAADCNSDDVNSPTFVYLNIYDGKKKIFHFDLYRLRNHEEFLALGFDEYLFAGGISCIEWSERIDPLLPPGCIRVVMGHINEKQRSVSISPWGGDG